MNPSLIAVVLGAALLGFAPGAHGQRMTEQFIPVGQSPGVSGVHSDIGEIAAVDAAKRTLTIEGAAGSRTVKLGPRTRIWLDRSQQRATNAVGSMSDLRAGRRVEVRYVNDTTKEAADWIKVVVPAGG
jgi:hypothetical protein